MTIRYRPIAIAIGTALFCPAFTLAQTPVMDEVLVSATRMERRAAQGCPGFQFVCRRWRVEPAGDSQLRR